MKFLLSAGEASGDNYGAQLIAALGQLAPGAEFFGMGGEAMRAAGLDVQIHANEVAVVGLAEVITHLPAIRRRFKRLVEEAGRRRPEAAVLIDFLISTCAWRTSFTGSAFRCFTSSARNC